MLACIQDIQKSKHIKHLPAARDFVSSFFEPENFQSSLYANTLHAIRLISALTEQDHDECSASIQTLVLN